MDVVIGQEPDSGTKVEPGTRVNLVVSQGEEVKHVLMEKLVGKNIEEAKNILKKLDLVEGDIVYQPSEDVEKDIVTWQSYEQGTELETKTAVDLYVSNGPSEETPGDNNPNDNNDSNVESSITFNLTPFLDKEETQIKIIRIQDGISKVVYNLKHKASDGEVEITLEGKVGALFEIFYDDVYQATIPKTE